MSKFVLVDEKGYFFVENEKQLTNSWPDLPKYSKELAFVFETFDSAETFLNNEIHTNHKPNFCVAEVDDDLNIIHRYERVKNIYVNSMPIQVSAGQLETAKALREKMRDAARALAVSEYWVTTESD
jgi:hypothetical protein